jgi:hypothetical protein
MPNGQVIAVSKKIGRRENETGTTKGKGQSWKGIGDILWLSSQKKYRI